MTDLYFNGPSNERAEVHIIKPGSGEITLTLKEIERLREHVTREDDWKPPPKPPKPQLPPWCPAFDEIVRAKLMLRRLARLADGERGGGPDAYAAIVSYAQKAMDALHGGGVLGDGLEVDDDGGEAEAADAEQMDHENRRPER